MDETEKVSPPHRISRKMSSGEQRLFSGARMVSADEQADTTAAPRHSDSLDTGHPTTRKRHRKVTRSEGPSRTGQFQRLRQQFRRKAIEKQDPQADDRQLRLLAYSLVLGRRASPREDWNTLHAEAEQQGYVIAARFHDVAVPVTTTYFPSPRASRTLYTPPWQRPGWGEVERLIRDGLTLSADWGTSKDGRATWCKSRISAGRP
ncbi:hypothetical protein [Streptomyces niveus]|uniref:hypothetical protein n=1 Tax=Streptomyces niveus TaxID=193462 RepID=UPI00084C7C56|nr:hypothetical protein [Streptomyces niveus]